MKKKLLTLATAVVIGLANYSANAQCSGGTNAGTITPTTSWQTIAVNGATYLVFNASAPNYYQFSFCAASGGGASAFDTQITLLDNSGVAVPGGYNDDYCGTQSFINWQCTSSGTYRVLLTRYNCISQAGLGTLAYRYTSPPSCPGGLGSGVTAVAVLPYASGATTTCGAVNDLNSGTITLCASSNYYQGEDRVWYFTAAISGTVTATLTTASNRVSLSAFDGCPLLGNSAVCLSSSQGNGNRTISFCVVAGRTYYVIADSRSPVSCYAITNLTLSAPVPSGVCNVGTGMVAVAALPYAALGRNTCGSVNDLTAANTRACGNGTFLNGEEEVFVFTAAASGRIVVRINTTGSNTGIFVYEGCPLSSYCAGTGASCVANETSATGSKSVCADVIAGRTYYVVIDGSGACFNYSISITAPVATLTGATCGNPLVIPTLPFSALDESTACMGNDYTSGSSGSCGTLYESGEDKVYRYTSTSSECIAITLSGVSSNSIGFQVYSGCPGSGSATCIGSGGGAYAGTLTGSVVLPSAGVYYIIVDTWANPMSVEYNISIASAGSVSNDAPCNAIPMTLGVYYSGNNSCTSGAGEPAPPACWATPNIVNSMWYSFVATSASAIIRTSPGTLRNTQIAVYRGTCGAGLIFVACNDDASGCGGTAPTPTYMSQLTLAGLTIGTTYYVMIDGYNMYTGTFGLIAIDGASTLPDIYGQECGSPLPVCNRIIPVGDPGFQSFGNKCDFPGAGTNCLYTAERGSSWFQLNINAGGNLEFDIVPNDWPGAPSTVGTDYDFAIWKIAGASATSCAGILGGATPIRCNYSYLGATGLYSGVTNTAPAAYPGFDGAYEAMLPVAAGEVYLLIVSNYSNSTSGFTMTFSTTSPINYGASATTVYWTGAVDNDWFKVNNWGGCTMPACGIDAYILPSSANQPVVSVGGAVCRNLNIQPGASLTVNTGITLSVCGDFTNSGIFNAYSTSTISMSNAAVSQNIGGNLIAPSNFSNLFINKTGGSVTSLQDIDIAGNLTLQNATSVLNGNNRTIRLSGNLANAGQLNPGSTGTMIFRGTGSQTYINTDTLNNITMLNTGAGVNMTTHMIMANTGTMTLTSGRIITNAFEVRILNDASTAVTAGNTTSFVQGNLRRYTPSVISPRVWEFPVGTAAAGYQRLNANFYNGITPAISNILTTFNSFPAVIPDDMGSDPTCPVEYGDTLLNNGYWRMAGAGFGSADMHVTLNNLNYTNATSAWTVARSINGAAWAIPAITGAYACNTSPVTSVLRNGVSSFWVPGGTFDFGTAQGTPNPLPVELINLKAEPRTTSIAVKWKTASEKNNAGFEVQRSESNLEFNRIGWVQGLGTTNTQHDYVFDDKNVTRGITYYYRLRQIDFNGKEKITDIVSAHLDVTTEVTLEAYPNPYRGATNIVYTLPSHGKVSIQFADLMGKIIKKIDLGFQDTGKHNIRFSASEEGFKSGVYNVTLLFNGKPYRMHITELK